MPSKSPVSGGRRIQTRRSGVHGNGVFAVQDIAEGETLIEYKGEVITWKEALRRHPHDPTQPNHTFYFHIDDGRVIDGGVNGNAARWINHSCEPSCEADEQDGRVFIKALRNIAAGEELSYDYGLIIDEPYTKKLKAEFPCWCGSETCRGTLLAPKDDKEKKSGKKGRKSGKKSGRKAEKKLSKKLGKDGAEALKEPKKKAKAAKDGKSAKTGKR
ncbi:SET domain-containing protein-lysine N-methyltransferase [Variovorax sp. J22R24]|uniref:SET domain-containing protein n=1 Tax=Variovorax gracilis TaxID=3053502 RepID=UPI0025788BA7|nr:SET domain-containing protein-lysine N-methyltransferase [Variovorax sp. J22R24]MDM0105999.1 SET domain-containing protein-lysine N-methyltransferase [Variovorax sp. J22R24]